MQQPKIRNNSGRNDFNNILCNYKNSIVIRGIVPIDRMWDTSAIPAAIEVSFPYAAGTTIVLRPNGMAVAHIRHTKKYGSNVMGNIQQTR